MRKIIFGIVIGAVIFAANVASSPAQNRDTAQGVSATSTVVFKSFTGQKYYGDPMYYKAYYGGNAVDQLTIESVTISGVESGEPYSVSMNFSTGTGKHFKISQWMYGKSFADSATLQTALMEQFNLSKQKQPENRLLATAIKPVNGTCPKDYTRNGSLCTVAAITPAHSDYLPTPAKMGSGQFYRDLADCQDDYEAGSSGQLRCLGQVQDNVDDGLYESDN